MLPPLASSLDTTPLPLPQQITLKLGEAGHQREHQLAGRGPRVDTEIQNAKMHATPSQIIGEQQDFMNRSTEPADFRDRQGVAAPQAGDQLIQQRTLGDSGCSLHDEPGRPGTAKRIGLTVFGLIGGRNAGVPNDINGLAIHEATIFCHPPFVTNKMKARSRFVNSGERYTLPTDSLPCVTVRGITAAAGFYLTEAVSDNAAMRSRR